MADNFLTEEIIEKLSIKYSLPKTAIRAICVSPFRVLSETVRGDSMKGVNFIHLGKFAVKEAYKRVLETDPDKKEKQRKYRTELIKYRTELLNANKPNKTNI